MILNLEGTPLRRVEERTHTLELLSAGCRNLALYIILPNLFLKTAPRVANRIAEGKFKLDGKEYQLAKVLTTFFVNFIIGIGIIGIFTIRMT